VDERLPVYKRFMGRTVSHGTETTTAPDARRVRRANSSFTIFQEKQTMRNLRAITILFCIAALGLVVGLRVNTAEAFAAAPGQEAAAPPQEQQPQEQQSQEQEPPGSELFSADQLDNLLAPIALYPDPLLAQVLPASTFVDQIDEASRWLRANNDPNGIDEQAWDVSVKSVAHYPSVLYMMSSKIDWTTSLGQAYVNQSTDVMTSIQRLRAMAHAAGNLETNPQQQVITQGDYIQIDPMQPQYIYVPVYDPYAVYYQGGYGFGGGFGGNLISFGSGFAIGAWLNYDFDWGGRRVFYHGWGGGEGGWIGRSRPNVRINNAYVNNSYRNIGVNRQVDNHSVNYNNLNRYNGVHRNVTYNNVAAPARVNGSNPANRGNVGNQVRQDNPANQPNRGNVGTPLSQGNPAVGNKIIQRNVNTNDPRIDAYRGRQSATEQPRPSATTPTRAQAPQNEAVRPASSPMVRTAPRSPSPVFSGNRSGFDPQAASQRGQASRMSASQSRPAASSQSNARNQSRPASPAPAKSSGQSRSNTGDRR
jgi:hypothetical protein